VTRYVLDTNIISNITKPVPSGPLIAWMAEQADADLFITSLTVAEVWRGVLEKPAGRKRTRLETWFSGPDGPQALFAGRVLPFEERARPDMGSTDGRGKEQGPTTQCPRYDHRSRSGGERLHHGY
jgi:toxin FitB